MRGGLLRAWTRVREHLARRAEWYWAPALYTLAVVFLWRDLWQMPGGGWGGFGWDAIESYSPDVAFLSAEVGDFDWPLWNPYDRGGYPFIADPQPGAYYLFNVPFLLWGAVAGVGWWLIQIKILAHFVAFGSMMHLFLRSRGLPAAAAVVGGVAVMSSAPMLIHKASNLLWPLAWVPLIWLAIDQVLERPSWRRGCGLAAAVVLSGTAGSPPGFFYALILGFLYGVFRLGGALYRRAREAEPRWKQLGTRLAVALVVAAAVTGAMLAVTVLPGLELTEHTARSAARRGLAYALMGSLPIDKVITGMVAPTTGMNDVYCGALVLTLAVCALAVAPRRDGGAPIFLWVIAALGLTLAFGKHTPLLRWLVETLPGFELFRVAGRYKLMTSIALAALAGYGAAALLEAPRAWSRRRITTLAVAGVMVIFAAYIASAYAMKKPPRWLRPGHTPVTLALVSAVLIAGAVLHTRRAAALVVLAIAPFIVWDPNHYVHARGMAAEKRRDYESDRALIASLKIGHDYRIYDEFVLEQRAGSRLRVRDFRGYPSLDPLSLERYNQVLRFARTNPRILEAYNVKYVLHGPHHRNRRSALLRAPPSRGSPGHFRMVRPKVFESLHPAPIVAWYGGVRVVADARRSLPAVLATEEAGGARRFAVMEQSEVSRDQRLDALARASAPPPAVAGRLESFDTDEVTVRIDAPAPGLVVLNEVTYPGWQVTVDGARATPLVANHLLRAVAVDAGPHRIRWRFRPHNARLYLALFLLGLLALIAARWAPPRSWWRERLDRWRSSRKREAPARQ